jgi:hypothetical protein
MAITQPIICGNIEPGMQIHPDKCADNYCMDE